MVAFAWELWQINDKKTYDKKPECIAAITAIKKIKEKEAKSGLKSLSDEELKLALKVDMDGQYFCLPSDFDPRPRK